MAEAVAVLGILSSVGSGVMGARAAVQQAEATAEAAEFNRRLIERRGRQEERVIRKKGRRLLSSQAVKFAKAGVRSDTGTPLELLAQNAAAIEREALNARFNTQTAAGLEHKRARTAVKTGRQQAISSLLTGVSQGAGTGFKFFGGSG